MSTPTLILNGNYVDDDGIRQNLPFDIWGTVDPVLDSSGVIVDVKVNTWATTKGSGPNGPLFETD